jgi:hypothetical protein
VTALVLLLRLLLVALTEATHEAHHGPLTRRPSFLHALGLAGLVAAIVAGCGSVADPMPCYGGPTPSGALLWDCTLTRCSFGCEVGSGFAETVAAPSEAAARTCLQDLLATSGDATVMWRIDCRFVGTWNAGPGGAPNAITSDEEDAP